MEQTTHMGKEEPKKPIPVRTRLYPAFYRDFHCLADGCRDNCCTGWRIEFSKKDYLTIKRAKKSPELTEIMDKAMVRLREKGSAERYAGFTSQAGPCPFFNEQGLCALQMECGPATLPQVCQTFPRAERYTPMGEERSLSTACEGVLQLLWDLPDGIDFVAEDLPRQEWRQYGYTPGRALFPLLQERCIDVLQARQFSLPRRILLMGLVLDEVRRSNLELDGGAWSRKVDLLLSDPSLSEALDQLPSSRGGFLAYYVRSALQLASSTPLYVKIAAILECQSTPGEGDGRSNTSYRADRYREAEENFQRFFGDLSAFWENVAVSTWFHLGYPNVESPEDMWKSYVNFCNLYGFFRFSAIAGCGMDPSREELFHTLVQASRKLLHSWDRQTELRDEFFQHDSATLAHMAVLVRG